MTHSSTISTYTLWDFLASHSPAASITVGAVLIFIGGAAYIIDQANDH